MKRHSTDLVGLLFGSAFLIAGVGFLVRETTDTVVNPAWVTGLGLMLLGAIALVATVARGVTHRDDEHEQAYAFAQPLSPYGYGAPQATGPVTTVPDPNAPAPAEPTAPEAPTTETTTSGD